MTLTPQQAEQMGRELLESLDSYWDQAEDAIAESFGVPPARESASQPARSLPQDTASVVERLLAETPAEAIRSDTRSLRRLPDGTPLTKEIADAFLQRLAVMPEDYEQPQIDLDLEQRLMKADRSLDYIEYGNDHWSEAEDPEGSMSLEEKMVRSIVEQGGPLRLPPGTLKGQ